MVKLQQSRGIAAVPVDPDILLAEHIEYHLHLYVDSAMFVACLLFFSGAYAATHFLLDNLW
ncbi:hypothetical protein [Paraburkholderia acidipaludis]|uniref:hypothetical protein n=1 Tax=Paraburkholderia acidipaludis TaxID=660537 RepID=UPI0004861106|nr:hypothetical protein [Paraburkholderia acidipaludis]